MSGALSSIKRKSGFCRKRSMQVGQRSGRARAVTYLHESTPWGSAPLLSGFTLYLFPRQDWVVLILTPVLWVSTLASRNAFNSCSFYSLHPVLDLHESFNRFSSTVQFILNPYCLNSVSLFLLWFWLPHPKLSFLIPTNHSPVLDF